MRVFLAVLAGLAAYPAAAQTLKQEVYEGTIGKSPVVVELLTYKDAGKTLTSGQYFYSKYRRPIALSAGTTPLTFTEADPNCYSDCAPTATLSLKAAADGLGGTWQAARKPARVPVTLKRLAGRDYTLTEAVPDAASLAPALWSEAVVAAGQGNPFLKKLYDADLSDGAETRTDGIGYRLVTHSGTKVGYVRLTAHPDPNVLKTANARLDMRRYEYQSWALECAAMLKENGQGPGYGGYEDISVKVAYVTTSLMFVEEAGSTYCGGAHPNNFWTLTGFDLRTGGRLDMNRLLKLYDAPIGGQGDDRPETPEFAALKAKLKPASPWFVAGGDMSECLAEDLGYSYSLSFNAKGLVFSLTDLPHVMGACMGEYYVVPYAELKALWRPAARAYFPGV